MQIPSSWKKRLAKLAQNSLAHPGLLWLPMALLAATPAPALPHGPALPAAFAPTTTACHFTTGPLAGTTGDYASPHDLKIGAPCENQHGSRGTVVALRHHESKDHPPPPEMPVIHAPAPTAPAPAAPAPGAPHPAPTAAPAAPTAGPPAPIQEAPTASQPHPSPSAAYANLTDSQIDQEFDQIVKRAGNGAIQYNVPPSMTVGQPVTVQVEVYGANAQPQSAQDFQPTGSGNLKVTPLMQLDLSAPNSPGVFKFDPDPVQSGQQMVPDDGKVDWVWTVTPLQARQLPESLQIDAYMVLNEKLPDGQAVTRQIKSYTVQVPVQSQSVMQHVSSFIANNWTTLLSYIVPSGGLFGLIAWLRSRKKTKVDAA
jgi:hypothetical protein